MIENNIDNVDRIKDITLKIDFHENRISKHRSAISKHRSAISKHRSAIKRLRNERSILMKVMKGRDEDVKE